MPEAWLKGQALPTIRRGPVTRLDLVRYAGASGDYNPIHTIEEFAQAAGLGGVIAHGMLSMAYLGTMLTLFAGDDADLVEFGVRFRAMVRPGDVIECQGTITELVEEGDRVVAKVQFMAKTDKEDTVIKGHAVLSRLFIQRAPREVER